MHTWLGCRGERFSEGSVESAGVLSCVSHDGHMGEALSVKGFPAHHPTHVQHSLLTMLFRAASGYRGSRHDAQRHKFFFSFLLTLLSC